MFCIFCSAWAVVFPPHSPEIPVGVLRAIQDGCANDPPNLCIIKNYCEVTVVLQDRIIHSGTNQGQRADSE